MIAPPLALEGHGAEQVFQTGVTQGVRVALHVEVDVAGVRGGQGREPVRDDHPDGDGAGRVVVGAGSVLNDLELRL